MAQQPKAVVTWEEGWPRILAGGVKKLQDVIQNEIKQGFLNQEYVDLYTYFSSLNHNFYVDFRMIYDMCIQKVRKKKSFNIVFILFLILKKNYC